MFWARRRPEGTSPTDESAQTGVVELPGTTKRNEDETVPKDGSAVCSEKKYVAALSRLERKVQCCNKKYVEALNKLEKKVQLKKNENVVSCGTDVGSFLDRRRNHLHGAPGVPSVINVSSVHENSMKEKPVPSGNPENQLYCQEQDVHSDTSSPCLKVDVYHCYSTSTKSINTSSTERQPTSSTQDLKSTCCTAIEGNSIGSESLEGEPPNDEKNVSNREVCSNDCSNDSSNQELKECVFPTERIYNDLIKVFRCNFCSTYYLYYESYQEHKKKCLTCSKCDLTFSSISELYKHVTSKAHKEYFSFLEVCKWTQSQLKSRIYKNEVYENDVKKFILPEIANPEKELSALMADSSTIGKSLASYHQNQDSVNTSSLPCGSASFDLVTSAQGKNKSHSTSHCMTENKTQSKCEDIGSPTHNRETERPMEENNNEIVCIKKPQKDECLVGPSGNIKIDITRLKETCNDDTQESKHISHVLPHESRSGRKFAEIENSNKTTSPGKSLSIEASKSRNVLCKSSQKIERDCKSPHTKYSNGTPEKALNGSEPEKIYTKVQPSQTEQSDSALLQIDSKIITSKYSNIKDNKTQGKVHNRQQKFSKKLHQEKSRSRALKTKNTSNNLLKGADCSSNSISGKSGHKRKRAMLVKQKVASAGSKNSHPSDFLTIGSSSDKENNNFRDATSSSFHTSSSQGCGNSVKNKAVVTSGQTKRPLKRSHSFVESAPKSIKLLMKTMRVTSDFALSCRKLDCVPRSCPGCSNRIDNTTVVYNTKSNHVSFWCQTCKWDIVFSADE